MKYALRWLLLGGGLILVVTAGFSFYGNFLLDYSLDNLEKALTVSETIDANVDPLIQNVYQEMVQGMALEEVASQVADNDKDVDVQSAMFLDLASRSIGEAEHRMGNQRAGVYLEEVVRKKKNKRFFIFRIFDEIYFTIKRFFGFIKSMVTYSFSKITGGQTIEDSTEYSSIFLLSKAETLVKDGNLEEAVALYQQFLSLYGKHPERGFVAISLSNILVRQKNYEEAKGILRQIKKDFLGKEESSIASGFLERISKLEGRQKLIHQLRQGIPAHEGTETGKQMKLRLAISLFSAYQFEESEELLLNLVKLEEYPDIAQKAKFYLGWLYKITEKLDQSTEVLLGLIDSPDLVDDLRLGLHVQLADTYYLQNNLEEALTHLEIVSGSENRMMQSLDVAGEAWSALADLERANIYYFDLGDAGRGREALIKSGKFIYDQGGLDILSKEADIDYKFNLRNRGFAALAAGRVHVAFELLNKNLEFFPQDPWTHSGLATIHLLFADLDQAKNLAEKGYRWHADEYTSAVLAYVYGYTRNYRDAISLYRHAIEVNPEYLPALFNLACMHLELDEFKEALEPLEFLEEKIGKGDSFMLSKVMNNIGYALWWLGREPEAEEYFRLAIDQTPDFDVALHNLDQVASGDAPRMVEV